MVGASYRVYEDYEKFITDFLFSVIDNGYSAIIVNYKDYQGLVASLNGKVLNGNTIALGVEYGDLFDKDIAIAMIGDGNIMVTVYDNGYMTGEPVTYPNKEQAFSPMVYFVEAEAADSAIKYAITSTIVPFKIEQKIRI